MVARVTCARGLAGRDKPVPYELIDGFFEDRTLFDLERDPMETKNVAAANPGVVARLEKRFASA